MKPLQSVRGRILGAACIALVLSATAIRAVPPPAGVAPVDAPAGGFAIDGDLIANQPGGGTGDWLKLPSVPGTGEAVVGLNGVPLNPNVTFHYLDPAGVSGVDNIFQGGKWFDDPNDWAWSLGKSSEKTDINNVQFHLTTDADGHVWVVVSADRLSNNGASYIDFEFLQNTLLKNSNFTFTSQGPDGGRTANDLLLSLAFPGGGTGADFFASRWTTNGLGGYTYVDATTSLPTGKVFIAVNSDSTFVPYGAFGQTNYAAKTFAEAAIDLTALLGNLDPCLSISAKTIMVKTKASPSPSANIEDFIDPIQYTLRIGPAADAGPNQTVCNQGPTNIFQLNGEASRGIYPIQSTVWSVVNGNVTIDSPGSLDTVARLTSSTATLRLTVIQANGCVVSDDVLLTVASLPHSAIAGPSTVDPVCPNGQFQLSGPDGMASYSWSIAGNGSLIGAKNQKTVTVAAGTNCAEAFTVSLVVGNALCTDGASAQYMVLDTTAPVLVLPQDRILECPADTRTNATGVATATDGCGGPVAIAYSDVVNEQPCGGTKSIARTWTATDSCGNSTSGVQNIVVQDTTAPGLQIPANLTLEYPANTQPAGTGTATGSDACGQATITFADAVTNGCGNTVGILRTWTATDECGNSRSGVQSIVVKDTTAPQLVIPQNLTLECPADTSTNATGVATATDASGSLTVTYSDVVNEQLCGGTKNIARTWTAIDSCGNSTSGVQNIVVQDTTAPGLQIPTSLTLEYPANTQPANTGTATGTDACGQVTITSTDVVTNGCGNMVGILRTWTATDECGNSSSAVQSIVVQDTTAPQLVIPQNLTLECPANTSTNATGVATATDASGSLTVTYRDVVNDQLCGGTKSIARTWTAMDACGNSTSGLQAITVVDTTPPSLQVPANLTLEYPANTTPNATGVATGADTCGQVTISYADVVTNACGGTLSIARTWTAVDACGNSTSGLQSITVVDTTAPALVIPQNLTLECPASTVTGATGMATATDASGSTTISYVDVVNEDLCGGTKSIARTWTAVDACGNSSSALQTIAVVDTTPPTLQVPTNLTLEYPANTATNATGVATAADTCGQVTMSFSDVTTNECGGTLSIKRTWTAVDSCGNATSGLQTITVVDTTAPNLVIPQNLTLECPADTSTGATGVATATDANGSPTITFTDVVNDQLCGGTKSIARTWKAVDACGNSTSGVQNITVVDTTPPTMQVPVNVTLEYPANTGTNATGVATGTDTCGQVRITFSDAITNGCGSTVGILRTWTATDECGNHTSRIQSIVVVDTTAPSLVIPQNLTLECPADTTTSATGVATATDANGTPTVTYSDVVDEQPCGGTKIVARTWKAVDACGNSTSGLQTITVVDTTPPTLQIPANLTLEYPASTGTNATGVATGTDTCGQVTISYTDVVTNACGATKTVARTWRAVDACGNSTSALQTITVVDTTRPNINVPANLTLQYPANTGTNATGVATATDANGPVIIGYSDVVNTNCGLTRTILRTWTATDKCGNTTNGLQTIAVVDTQKPTITSRAISVQCADDVPAVYANLAAFLAAGGTATDNSDPSLTFSVTSAGELVGSCPGTVTRVYRVTDDCGNFAESTQRITVDDTIAPTLICPPGMTVQCTESLDPVNTGSATATDNCDANVSITHSDAVVPSTYDINWYASDPVVGSAPYLPSYLKLAPANLPRPTTGRAMDPLRNAVAYGPTAGQLDALTSLGGEPMALGQVVPFQAVIDVSGGPGPEHGTIEFTTSWSTHTTSNDEFGYDKNYKVYCAFVDPADIGSIDPHLNAKVDSYSSTIINAGTIDEKIQGTFRVSGLDTGDRVIVEVWVVLMSTQPDHVGGTIASDLVSAQKVLSPPQPITTGSKTISIGNLNRMNQLPAPQSQPPLPPLPPQPPIEPGFIVSVIDRTWTATDDCGNQNSCVQRFTVRDAVAPVITAPANVVLEYPADTRTNVTGVAVAQDACGSSTVTYSDIVSNTCGLTKVVSRTWTARDEWGNITNVVQTIAVVDTTAPVLQVPANVTLEFPANTAVSATGIATATDANGSPTVTHSDVVTAGCGSAHTIARTWTAVDACGNSSSGLQTIAVVDTTAPVLQVPANVTLEYPANTTTSARGVATATDASGSPTITHSDVITSSCGSAMSIARTWTAMDACGNSTSGLQIINVVDTTAPVLQVPANLTLEFPANTTTSVTGVATATDASGATTITYNDVMTSSCGNTMSIARTWKAVDACGNSTSGLQTINVVDTTAPVLQVPGNITLEYPANTTTSATGVATATDAGGFPTITHNDVITSACGNAMSIARTWTAVDSCGNSSSGLQTIAVVDTTAPVLQLPANVTLEYPANTSTSATGVATATDAGGSPTITYSDVVSNSCGNAMSIARTWTAMDACGNSSSGLQTINVVDTTAPVIQVPANVTLEYPANTSTNATGLATATDANETPIISYSDVVSNSCGSTMSIARTWTAMDACGNSTSGLQIINVVDTTAPVIQVPANVTLEYPANTSTNATGLATATDANGTPIISYSDVVSNSCGSAMSIARTWTAMDACGNSSSGLQTINVVDTTAPVIQVPANVTLEYPANTSTNATGLATATDANGTPIISYSDVVTNPGTGMQNIARTWTAVDACGNTSSGVQTINVVDTTPPLLQLPLSVTLEFPTNTSTNTTGVATASDASGSFSITYSDVTTSSCGGASSIARTWKAVDTSGNSVSGLQTINVVDTTAPVLQVPANVTLEYPANTAIITTGMATATDANGSPTITYNDVMNSPVAGMQNIVRTWTAVDACGNSSSGVQTISVADTTAPVFGAMQDRIVLLGQPLAFDEPVVTDNSGQSPAVSIVSTTTNTTDVAVKVTRAWSASDACGNTSSASQTLTVMTASTLEIFPMGGGKVMLQWPEQPAGFQLEYCLNLNDGQWFPVLGNPIIIDGKYRLEVDARVPMCFFRLSKQIVSERTAESRVSTTNY